MAEPLIIEIKTLTPLWTGGVDGTCDRLHISGLMGSMRYWYEAIVRGVGGYACDPSNGGGCIFKPSDKEHPENIGIKSICAACYLFGTTGWARLFRLTAMVGDGAGLVEAEEPLHFQSHTSMNQAWLKIIFEGIKDEIPTRSPIGKQHTLYPSSPLKLVHRWRGIDLDYAQSQMTMLYRFLEQYAGLGAKQQFGFGQIALVSSQISAISWKTGLAKLNNHLPDFHPLVDLPSKQTREEVVLPYPDLRNFFAVSCQIDNRTITGQRPLGQIAHPEAYISSAFDIRYKTNGRLGFRIWLEKKRAESDPQKKSWSDKYLRAFVGASTRKNEAALEDEERTACRVFVSMPYADNRFFAIRMYGFALPEMQTPDGKLTPEIAASLCAEYLGAVRAICKPPILGSNLLAEEPHA